MPVILALLLRVVFPYLVPSAASVSTGGPQARLMERSWQLEEMGRKALKRVQNAQWTDRKKLFSELIQFQQKEDPDLYVELIRNNRAAAWAGTPPRNPIERTIVLQKAKPEIRLHLSLPVPPPVETGSSPILLTRERMTLLTNWILAITILTVFFTGVARRKSPLLMLVGIWILRAVLLAAGLPGTRLGRIFHDPAYFSFQGFGGLFADLGNLILTALAVWATAKILSDRLTRKHANAPTQWTLLLPAASAAAMALLSAILFFVRLCVQNSSTALFDPVKFFSLPAGILMAAVFLFASGIFSAVSALMYALFPNGLLRLKRILFFAVPAGLLMTFFPQILWPAMCAAGYSLVMRSAQNTESLYRSVIAAIFITAAVFPIVSEEVESSRREIAEAAVIRFVSEWSPGTENDFENRELARRVFSREEIGASDMPLPMGIAIYTNHYRQWMYCPDIQSEFLFTSELPPEVPDSIRWTLHRTEARIGLRNLIVATGPTVCSAVYREMDFSPGIDAVMRIFFVFFLFSTGLYLIEFICLGIAGLARRPRWRFEYTIACSFLVVTAIPLALVGWFNKETMTETYQSSVTDKLASNLVMFRELVTVEETDPHKAAARTGITCALYSGGAVKTIFKGSSAAAAAVANRPSGQAFLNINLLGKDIYFDQRRINGSSIITGYAPLRSGPEGAVIAVPLILSDEALRKGLTVTLSYTLGMYALIFVITLILAILAAKSISRPVRRLSEASDRIGSGDLDIDLSGPLPGGDMGTLYSAFRTMIGNLRRYRSQLVDSERKLARQQMARQVAHEIKNALTPVKLSAQLIEKAADDRRPDLADIIKQPVRSILRYVESLRTFIAEFSSLGRLPDITIVPTDVNAVIRDTLAMFRSEPNAEIQINTELDEGLPRAQADPDELGRVLVNLVENAIESIREQGTVSVRSFTTDGHVCVDVEDNGPGIAPRDLEKIFEPEFSTRTSGTGLGLAIARASVEACGGTLTAASTPGEKTVFSIRLNTVQQAPRTYPVRL